MKNSFKYYIIFIGLIMMFMSLSVYGINGESGSSLQRYRDINHLSETQLFDLAKKFDKEGMKDSTLIYYNVLYNRYKPEMPNANKNLCARALLEAGNIFYSQTNYSKAMDLLLQCQYICEENNFNALLADVYRALGNIYSSHVDYERSIMFYLKSLSIADSIGNVSLQSKTLNNLIGAYSFDGKKEEAKQCYNRLIKTPDSDMLYPYNVLIGGGLVAAADSDKSKASQYYREAAEYARINQLGVRYTGAAYSLLAALYEQNADSALHYLKLNEMSARQTGKHDLLVETLRSLASLYKKTGDNAKWIEYQTEYLNLSNEVFNQREFNSLKNADFLYELNKSNNIINNLNIESRQKDIQISTQRQIMWILGISVLIFICLGIVIYFQKRRLAIAYTDLFEKNLSELEKEKAYSSRLHELEAKLENKESDDLLTEKTSDEEVSTVTDKDSEEDSFSEYISEKLRRDILAVMEQTDVICDSEFSIKKLAELVDSNTTYVSRVINEMTGNNFRTFLSEYRIKESMLRLNDNENYGNWTIKAIAENVGYKSQSNFISVFTKYTGIKPSIYQKMALKHKIT